MRASTGKIIDYYIHEAPDSVLCVCINGTRVLIEKQYRPSVNRFSVDYPAGRIENTDRSIEDAVRRELKEETGYAPMKITHLATVDKDPSFSNACLHIYLVQGVRYDSADPDDTEDIVSKWVENQEVLSMIQSGEIRCSFCIAATFYAFRELGWLETQSTEEKR